MTAIQFAQIERAAGRDARIGQAREVMYTAYAKGWITHRDGNISVRDEGSGGMWISESGVVKVRLQAMPHSGQDVRELGETFPEITRYSRVGNDVGALPATSEDLAVACAKAFRLPLGPTPHIVGLDRHGAVAVGRSTWDAYEHASRLEHVCQMVLASGVRHAANARTLAPGAAAVQATSAQPHALRKERPR